MTLPENPPSPRLPGWRLYLNRIARLGFIYLAVVAVLAALVAVVSWPAAVPVAWLVPAVVLFGKCLQVGSEQRMLRDDAGTVVGVLVAIVATTAFAFLGLVVAMNIWLATGRGF